MRVESRGGVTASWVGVGVAASGIGIGELEWRVMMARPPGLWGCGTRGGALFNLPATYYSLNNKSPVEIPEHSSYRLIRIFEVRILTPKREQQPNWGKILYFHHFSPRKGTKFWINLQMKVKAINILGLLLFKIWYRSLNITGPLKLATFAFSSELINNLVFLCDGKWPKDACLDRILLFFSRLSANILILKISIKKFHRALNL